MEAAMKTFFALVMTLGLAAPAFADGNVWDVLQGKKPAPASPTPAPPQQQNHDVWPGQHAPQASAATNASKEIAKRSVDVAGVELQVAKLYVTGLYDLSSRQNLYDQRHATALFNRAQDALTGAELQLQELAPLASANYPKAGEPLGRARSTLVSAQGELRTLAGAINRNGNDVERIKSVFHQLDTAEHALNDTAGAMSVDSKLNAP
jgi:hypothetical protein